MGPSPIVKRGSVVLVRFPFSDLSASKLRPAVVVADVARPGKVFTANEALVVRQVGELTDSALEMITSAVVRLLVHTP